MEILICTLIGYLLGSFQSSYVFVKMIYKTDIRNVGSGNAGMTNTLMNFGKTTAMLVLFCDIMKTIIATLICTVIMPKADSLSVISMTCLGVALGHNFPFWLKFKGGKGVAVAVATALVLDIRIFLIAIFTAAIFSWLTKSASYGSYTFAIMIFICSMVLGYKPIIWLSILIQSFMITALHAARKKEKAEII
ncbi:MAG: glycerol-3-phosphate acyltransferase [Faecalibacterium sp.]|nr:glycerol-3-phosphate acyltransferase [Ruminococcus sp.]MCM1393172.1 glycerol-3-phosphate acyltransferase [Ruminococcus sp.]MCM1485211.1 glycerol-3-phosphate acyltransferase [Faecalibacterium sp.]